MVTPVREEGVAMKIFFWTLALLMAGLVFAAPPLIIVVLPALVVGGLLMAAPLIMGSMTRMDQGGRTRDDGSGVRRDPRPTSAPTAR
jgi:hypothetical protein